MPKLSRQDDRTPAPAADAWRSLPAALAILPAPRSPGALLPAHQTQATSIAPTSSRIQLRARNPSSRPKEATVPAGSVERRAARPPHPGSAATAVLAASLARKDAVFWAAISSAANASQPANASLRLAAAARRCSPRRTRRRHADPSRHFASRANRADTRPGSDDSAFSIAFSSSSFSGSARGGGVLRASVGVGGGISLSRSGGRSLSISSLKSSFSWRFF